MVVTRTRKMLRHDEQAESVMGPFVLIIALVLVLSFVISGITQYAVSGSISQGDLPGMTMPFGLSDYTTIEPYDSGDPRIVDYGTEVGFQVSDDDVLDSLPYPTDEDPFMFVDDNGDVKYIHIIRNNVDYDSESTDMWEMYQDFIAIRRHSGAWIGSAWEDAAVPFSELEANFDPGDDNSTYKNISLTNFRLGDSQDSLFLNATIPGEDAFISALWDNEFMLFYGWSLFRITEVDFWGAISMLMYAEIPGVHPLVNFFIHAFVVAIIVFVIFTMAIRMTPFLGGA